MIVFEVAAAFEAITVSVAAIVIAFSVAVALAIIALVALRLLFAGAIISIHARVVAVSNSDSLHLVRRLSSVITAVALVIIAW